MRAFTLVEIIIVVALTASLAGLGLFMSLDTLRGTVSRSEAQAVGILLQKARSRALAGVEGSAWGVCFLKPDYILFRGTACTPGIPGNEVLPANPAAPALFSAPIVFSTPAATSTGGTVTFVQNGRVSTTTINTAGRIDW